MKSFKQHIFEKLKVSTTPSAINDKQFFDAVFNYCKANDCLEITALDIYKEFKNIPKECIDLDGNRNRINFALRPTGEKSIINIEIWEYNIENKPIGLLTNIKANDYAFDFLKNKFFDEDIILDIYNYCA
jgi:hypothetical protein